MSYLTEGYMPTEGGNFSSLSVAGASTFLGNIDSSNAAGFRLSSGAAGATTPTLMPNKADTNTGIGWAAADNMSFISAGVEVMRFNNGQTNFSAGVFQFVGGQMRQAKGADLASANNMAQVFDGNYYDVTGTTQINTMTAANGGTVVTLQFDGSLTVKHATAGTLSSFALAGAVDFSATAGDTLTLVYDGTDWREIARAVI